jgi:hypothetical protein
MSRSPEDRDDPYRSCTITVEGDVASQLVDLAIDRAVIFLGEPRGNLYAAHVGNATPVKHSPYRQHLGVSPLITRWQATITVRLLPEIVRERRERAEEARGDADPSERAGRRSRPLKLV